MDFVEVGYKAGAVDPTGTGVKAKIREDLFIKGIEKVSFVDVYYFPEGFSREEIRLAADQLLTDPIIQENKVNRRYGKGFDWIIEVKYLPEVTDNAGIAAVEGLQDLLGRKLGLSHAIRTGRKYLLKGKISRPEAEKIASGALANQLIEEFTVAKGRK